MMIFRLIGQFPDPLLSKLACGLAPANGKFIEQLADGLRLAQGKGMFAFVTAKSLRHAFWSTLLTSLLKAEQDAAHPQAMVESLLRGIALKLGTHRAPKLPVDKQDENAAGDTSEISSAHDEPDSISERSEHFHEVQQEKAIKNFVEGMVSIGLPDHAGYERFYDGTAIPEPSGGSRHPSGVFQAKVHGSNNNSVGQDDVPSLEVMLEDVLRHGDHHEIEILFRRELTLHPDLLRKVLMRCIPRQEVRVKLVQGLPESILQQAVQLIEADGSDTVLGLAVNAELFQLSSSLSNASTSEARQLFWMFTLAHLAVERGNQFSTRDYVSSLLQQWAAHGGLSTQKVLTIWLKAWQTETHLSSVGQEMQKLLSELFFVTQNPPPEHIKRSHGLMHGYELLDRLRAYLSMAGAVDRDVEEMSAVLAELELSYAPLLQQLLRELDSQDWTASDIQVGHRARLLRRLVVNRLNRRSEEVQEFASKNGQTQAMGELPKLSPDMKEVLSVVSPQDKSLDSALADDPAQVGKGNTAEEGLRTDVEEVQSHEKTGEISYQSSSGKRQSRRPDQMTEVTAEERLFQLLRSTNVLSSSEIALLTKDLEVLLKEQPEQLTVFLSRTRLNEKRLQQLPYSLGRRLHLLEQSVFAKTPEELHQLIQDHLLGTSTLGSEGISDFMGALQSFVSQSRYPERFYRRVLHAIVQDRPLDLPDMLAQEQLQVSLEKPEVSNRSGRRGLMPATDEVAPITEAMESRTQINTAPFNTAPLDDNSSGLRQKADLDHLITGLPEVLQRRVREIMDADDAGVDEKLPQLIREFLTTTNDDEDRVNICAFLVALEKSPSEFSKILHQNQGTGKIEGRVPDSDDLYYSEPKHGEKGTIPLAEAESLPPSNQNDSVDDSINVTPGLNQRLAIWEEHLHETVGKTIHPGLPSQQENPHLDVYSWELEQKGTPDQLIAGLPEVLQYRVRQLMEDNDAGVDEKLPQLIREYLTTTNIEEDRGDIEAFVTSLKKLPPEFSSHIGQIPQQNEGTGQMDASIPSSNDTYQPEQKDVEKAAIPSLETELLNRNHFASTNGGINAMPGLNQLQDVRDEHLHETTNKAIHSGLPAEQENPHDSPEWKRATGESKNKEIDSQSSVSLENQTDYPSSLPISANRDSSAPSHPEQLTSGTVIEVRLTRLLFSKNELTALDAARLADDVEEMLQSRPKMLIGLLVSHNRKAQLDRSMGRLSPGLARRVRLLLQSVSAHRVSDLHGIIQDHLLSGNVEVRGGISAFIDALERHAVQAIHPEHFYQQVLLNLIQDQQVDMPAILTRQQSQPEVEGDEKLVSSIWPMRVDSAFDDLEDQQHHKTVEHGNLNHSPELREHLSVQDVKLATSSQLPTMLFSKNELAASELESLVSELESMLKGEPEQLLVLLEGIQQDNQALQQALEVNLSRLPQDLQERIHRLLETSSNTKSDQAPEQLSSSSRDGLHNPEFGSNQSPVTQPDIAGEGRVFDARSLSKTVQEFELLLQGSRSVLEELLARLQQDAAAMEALIKQVPESLLTRLLYRLRGDDHHGIQEWTDRIAGAWLSVVSSIHPFRIRLMKWRFILGEWLKQGLRFELGIFAREFVHYLSKQVPEEDMRSLIPSLIHQLKQGSASGNQSQVISIQTALTSLAEFTEPVKSPGPNTMVQKGLTHWPFSGDENIEAGEVIYLDNAGLVLAAPYLPRLFTMLDLIQEDRFRDEASAERGVHLLQYLVEGSTSAPEYRLVLNKILCGLPLDLPIDGNIELSDHERETADGLLLGMLQNWKGIGNTSVEGLRESFLRREGRLEIKDDAWHLLVAPKPFDMLLDTLPWGFSVIKYRWMHRVIHVDWR